MKNNVLKLLAVLCLIQIFISGGLSVVLATVAIVVGLIIVFVAPLWIVAFIVISLVDGPKTAWEEIEPVKMTKELFFSKEKE